MGGLRPLPWLYRNRQVHFVLLRLFLLLFLAIFVLFEWRFHQLMIEIAHLSNDVELFVQLRRFLPRLALVDWNIEGNAALMRFLLPRLFGLRHRS